MPTSATAGPASRRICSASLATKLSASGSCIARAEISFEDVHRGDLVQHLALVATAHAGSGERPSRSMRAEPLVDQAYVETEATLQLTRKAPATIRQLVFFAVHVGRQAHHQQGRRPLLNQLGDRAQPNPFRRSVQRLQRVRDTDRQLTYRYANASRAE